MSAAHHDSDFPPRRQVTEGCTDSSHQATLREIAEPVEAQGTYCSAEVLYCAVVDLLDRHIAEIKAAKFGRLLKCRQTHGTWVVVDCKRSAPTAYPHPQTELGMLRFYSTPDTGENVKPHSTASDWVDGVGLSGQVVDSVALLLENLNTVQR